MKNIYIDVKDTEPGGGPVVTDEWVRPSDWLVLPTLVEGDQRVVGLHAVYGDSDFVAIYCAGAYTVDWGDGTIQNVPSNTKCDHRFDYSALVGTDCSRGYRQAIVTITPQSGQLLTAVSLSSTSSQSNVNSGKSHQWLDISVVGVNVSSLSIGGTTQSGYLEQFKFIGNNNITSFTSTFKNCMVLRNISIDTSKGTTFASMLSGCYELREVPAIDTSKGTDFTYMLENCYSLKKIRAIDTSSGLNFSYMCSNCYNLQESAEIDTSKGTAFTAMYNSCKTMKIVHPMNTSKGVQLGSMFSDCRSVAFIPTLDFSAATGLGDIFTRCFSLQTLSFIGLKENISLSNLKISAAQIELIFQSLPVVTGKTINVSVTWGVLTLTATQKAIAKNKGWTLIL